MVLLIGIAIGPLCLYAQNNTDPILYSDTSKGYFRLNDSLFDDHNDYRLLVNRFFRKVKKTESQLNKAIEEKDTGQIIRACWVLGSTHRKTGKYQESLRYNQWALDLSKRKKDRHRMAKSYKAIGDTYHFIADYDQAIYYFTKAVQLESNPAIYLSSIRGLGHIYRLTGNYDTALMYYNIAQENWDSNQDSTSIISLYGDKAKLYHAMGEYRKAYDLHMYCLAYILRTEPKNNYGLSGSLIEIAALLRDSGDHYQAIKYAEKGLKTALKYGSLEHVKEAYYTLYRSNFALHKYERAVEHFARYSETKDSLLNQDNLRQINELEIKYQSAEKEKTIQELQTEKALQDLKLQRKNTLIYIAILLIILILVVSFFVSRQLKLKAEQHSVELGLKLLRSQMNPHFIFNSLMNVNGFIYQKDNHKAEEYLMRFSKLVRLILENSRSELISLNHEIETLEYYLELQKVRFAEQFNYRIDLNIELEPDLISIPPMFLQPFVENSIEHGIVNYRKDGWISIRFYPEHNRLIAEVSDNGRGMEPKEKTGNKQSLAIKMTRERIQLLARRNKYKIELSIESEKHEGTQVRFSFPLQSINA